MRSFAGFFFAPQSSLAATQRTLDNVRKPMFVVTRPIQVKPVSRRLPCNKKQTIPPGVERHITRRAKKNAKK